MSDLSYGFTKTVPGTVDEVDGRVREALATQGFGVLTEIDVASTLKNKIDVDFRPYRILGACNPGLAHQALSEEANIGLLLPCNVVVYQGDDPNTTVVSILDPELQLGVSGRDDLGALAGEVRARMEQVLQAV